MAGAVRNNYDVIIVGAGPGGLTAASVLARKGLRVVVLDQSAQPGGTARTYARKGFMFPTGPLGFSNHTIVTGKLESLADTAGVSFKRIRYKLLAFGIEAPLSEPFDQMRSELGLLFPADSDRIDAFFNSASSVIETLHSTPEGEPPVLDEMQSSSAVKYFERLGGDERLRRLLGSIGTGEATFGFPTLAAMWDLMCNAGIWYPLGGFDSFAQRLAEGIEVHGGELSMRSRVTGIDVSDGRVRGVRLSDGSVLEAPAVISNADFKTTFLNLMASDAQPAEWRGAVERARETSSNIQVSLGAEEGAVDLSAFADATRIIYRTGTVDSSNEPDWGAPAVDPEALASQEMELSLWSGDDPALAPDGCVSLVIRTAADHAHFARYRPAGGGRKPEYAGYKAALARGIIREASKLIPGLEQAVRVIDVATPLTFEERGGRYAGAVAGWSQRHEDVTDHAVRPLVLTPVSGLYMAGHQAFSWLYWGGVPSAVLSGVRAAESVMRGDGPISRVTIPATI